MEAFFKGLLFTQVLLGYIEIMVHSVQHFCYLKQTFNIYWGLVIGRWHRKVIMLGQLSLPCH